MSIGRNNHFIQGDTMIEVVVVTFILVTALVALTSVTTVSIARNRLAKERAAATRLAQEGMEWVKAERDRLGFDVIDQMADRDPSPQYCLPTLPQSVVTDGEETVKGIDGLTVGACTADQMVAGTTMYQRTMQLVRRVDSSTGSPTGVDVTMTVQWSADKGVSLTGSVTPWSRQ